MLYNVSLEALTGSAKYFLIYLAIFTFFFSICRMNSLERSWSVT